MEKNYFVLYDLNDNIVCYLHSIYEVKKYLPNYRIRDIKRRLINHNFINIYIDNLVYKLYKFS